MTALEQLLGNESDNLIQFVKYAISGGIATGGKGPFGIAIAIS